MGDQLVDGKPPGGIKFDETRNIDRGIAASHITATDGFRTGYMGGDIQAERCLRTGKADGDNAPAAPGRGIGRLERAEDPGRFNRAVDAAPGHLQNFVSRARSAGDRVGRAEADGCPALLHIGIDRDDAPRAGKPGAEDGAGADPADTGNRDCFSRFDPARMNDAACAAHHGATEKRGNSRGQGTIDLHKRMLRYHGHFRKGGKTHVMMQNIAVQRQARAAREQFARTVGREARRAEMRISGDTAGADAALRLVDKNHPVAGGEPFHVCAGFLDDAACLVSRNDGHRPRADPGNDGQVGPAQARRVYADQHLVRHGSVGVDGFQRKGAAVGERPRRGAGIENGGFEADHPSIRPVNSSRGIRAIPGPSSGPAPASAHLRNCC